MTTIALKYQGQLRCKLTHQGNKESLVTDAPLDNNGRGENFSPTDLVAAALISCMMTIMGIAGNRKGLTLEANGTIDKNMASNPRRIDTLKGEIIVTGVSSKEEQHTLEQAARACPVALSLSPQLKQEINFIWA